MEFSGTNLSFCFLFIAFATILNPIFALKSCEFPAIFNFGDSNSDTGAMPAAFLPPNPPYGKTYVQMTPERYSDGRLIIDFTAQSLNHPYLSAYLNSMGTNFSHGANFAAGGSTIRIPTSIIPHGISSPFSLDVQLLQFLQFKLKSQLIRKQGGVFATLMPKEEIFPKALYTFDIGQNDIGNALLSSLTIEEVNASVPDVVNRFSENIQSIYNLGGRTFWIHNTGPIGCLPYILANFPSEKDDAGCAKPYNELAQYFNAKLNESIVHLRKNYPWAAFIYVDVYSVKYSLYTTPIKYGFELPLMACCGYGGMYNYSNNAGCGAKIVVNGSEVVVGSCDRPWVRVNWDGIHYTEAANKFVFDQISSGAFSQPPVPLSMSCMRFNNIAF
ncbi:esterase-like isoform X1 [Manihot esculenta]|uniref:Uncharacterized protein n=2 Tax=Manihot esculenta TaxID=3983 RepID=A0ACB7FYN8_MANES|nr:esterase-like isoform X1 [Manihot esculenta]KAG8633109.1 hypothetical protein MANES_18G077012v8 [Manihot esculenta]